MKKSGVKVLAVAIVMFAAMVLVGCGISKSQLEEEVAQSIQEYVDQKNGNPYLKYTVTGVTLIKVDKNQYTGIVYSDCENKLTGTTQEETNVSVVCDGKTFKWQLE